MALLVNCNQTFKKELIPILFNFFQNTEEEGTCPNPFYEASVTLYQSQRRVLQENYRPTPLMNTDAKILNSPLKGSRTMIKWDLSLGWLNIHKSINVIHCINKTNKKNHIFLLDAEKAFNKIQHPFMIKILNKLSIEKAPQHNKGNL